MSIFHGTNTFLSKTSGFKEIFVGEAFQNIDIGKEISLEITRLFVSLFFKEKILGCLYSVNFCIFGFHPTSW